MKLGMYFRFLMASAIGYMGGQKTGDALALAGLVCAMLTDVVQFLYMFRRLNLLADKEAGYQHLSDQDDTYDD